MSVRLVFLPETPIPLGFIPAINMEHPIKKSERLVPDLIYEDGKFFFDVDDISARQILERDGHCYKLWAPAEFSVVLRGKHGAEMVTLQSVNPALGKGKNKVVKPALKDLTADAQKIANAAAALEVDAPSIPSEGAPQDVG